MLNRFRRWFARRTAAQARDPDTAVTQPSPEQHAAVDGNAQLVRRTLADASGTDYPPGRAGIAYLDGFIERTRDSLDAEARERMGTITGCYLGAALIAEHGGAWVETAEGLGVRFSAGNVAYPLNKAAKHWQGGAGESMLSFFDVAGVLWAGKAADSAPPAG